MFNTILEDIRVKIKSGNPVIRLIMINIFVYLLITLFRILLSLSGAMKPFMSITSILLDVFTFPIGFKDFIYHPWSIITYSFAHIDLMHILFNMFTLYWFGDILMNYTSSKKIIPLYLLGGIVGALFAMLCIEFIPALSVFKGTPMVGASAGITAIITACAVLIPNFRLNVFLIGEIKLVYVAVFTIFISFLNVAMYSNVGGNLAHLGGALMGYLFILQYRKGRDLSKGINAVLEGLGKLFSRSSKTTMKVAYKRSVSDAEYNYSKKVEQQKIDEILDKISRSGYDSLSKAERDFLANIDKPR